MPTITPPMRFYFIELTQDFGKGQINLIPVSSVIVDTDPPMELLDLSCLDDTLVPSINNIYKLMVSRSHLKLKYGL